MEFDATVDDVLEQELMLLDNISQVVKEMGHHHLSNVVGAISDMISLRLTRNFRLMEQHMGCRIALRLDESGMIDGARLDFSPEPDGPDEEAGASAVLDQDSSDYFKKQ